MNAHALVNLCEKEYYAVIIANGVDRLKVRSPEPLPDSLLQELRERKAEILDILRPKSKEWHAQEIAARVRTDGLCVFWSEVVRDMVAFIRDDTFRSKVPCGIAVYTLQEIEELWGQAMPPLTAHTLKMIHETKRHGGKVTDRSKDIFAVLTKNGEPGQENALFQRDIVQQSRFIEHKMME